MRHPILLALSLVLACSGGATTAIVGGRTPAVLAVQAGDGQSAEPGAALTVKPVVAVKDAAGLGVAGVTVTFAVDSGGGSLQSTTATTATDGTASPGDWRLGTSEGRNVLSATAASLTKVKLVATAVIAAVTVATQTVGIGGGIIALNRPGLPLDGFQLQLPPAALTASAVISVSIRSAAAVSLPAGMTFLTPLVAISSTPVDLNQPAMMRFASPRQAGFIRVAVIRNPATGEMHFLPTVKSDATGITVALPDLTPWSTGGGPSGAGIRADFGDMEAGLTTLMETFIQGDFDTGYRPGVDDWDFPRQAIAGVPEVSPGATVDPAESMMGTSLWYFLNQKTSGALWKRFQDAQGISESNRRGLRWVGITGQVFTGFWWNSVVATTMNTEVQTDPANASRTMYSNVRLGLAGVLSSLGPVPIFLYAGSSNDAPKMGLVYRSVGNTLYFAIPDSPGQEFQAQFDATGVMQPFSVTTAGGGTYSVTSMQQASPINQLFKKKLSGQYPTVVAGTIGNIAGWPTPQLRAFVRTDVSTTNKDIDANDVILADGLQHWWKCPGCANSGYSTGETPVEDHFLLWRRVSRRADGTYGALPPTIFTYAILSAPDITPGLDAYNGYALYQPGPGSGVNSPNGRAWLDWQTVHYRKLPITVSPKNPEITAKTDLTFTGTVTGAPAGSTYRWRVTEPASPPEKGTPTVTPVPLVQTISRDGETTVIFEVFDPNNQRLLAADTSKVELTLPPKQAWRFTSVTRVAEVGVINLANPQAYFTSSVGTLDGRDIFYSGDYTEYVRHKATMDQVLANPPVGVIYFVSGLAAGVRAVALQVTAVGIAPDLTRTASGSTQGPSGLAAACAPVNTFQCAWYGINVTGDDTSGSITGKWFAQSTISATKDQDGVTLTGTIRLGEAGLVANYAIPAHYVEYSFSATRVPQ